MKHILPILLFCIYLVVPAFGKNIFENATKKQREASPQSLLQSMEKELQKPEYRQEILPNNFSHLIQLLDHGKKTNQPRAYAQSVFRLFGNILKGTQYINAYLFSDFLGKLPDLLSNYFILYKSQSLFTDVALKDLAQLDRFNQVVTKTLYTQFTSSYDQFRQDPAVFLDNLSQSITQITEEEIGIEQLRQTVIRFLEIGLSKLVWSPENNDATWESIKKISQNITKLMEHNIIDNVDDLDDLFWSITHRFCFFIDIASTNLPIEFYAKVKNEIAGQQLLLFELEEQESFIESKVDCLMRTILIGEAKKRAYVHG